MQILLLNQVFHPDNAATAQHATDLALHLIEKGCRVTVVASERDYNAPGTRYAKHENFRGIEIHRIGSPGLGKARFWRRVVESICFEAGLCWKLLFIPKHDYVIGFTSPPLIGIFGALFCLFKGGHFVNWLMDVNPDAAIEVGYLKRGSLISRLLQGIFKFTLKRSDSVVVLDSWMKRHVASYGIEQRKIFVVPPWPVPETLSHAPDGSNSAALRERWGLTGKFVIMYSGNHSVVHPMDTLLDAALRLKDDPTVQFVFVGSGLRVPEVKAFKEKHNLANILQFPPQPREVLRESLSLADVHAVIMGPRMSGLVHTSKIYGILATGKPYLAIAPEESHLVDLIRECPYGFHVQHGDGSKVVEQLRAIQRLSPQALQEFRSNNFDFLLKHYSPDAILDSFSDRVIGLDRHAPRRAVVAGT